MNDAHLHLIINHAPLFLAFAGLLVAVWGWARKVEQAWPIAYGLWVVGSLSAGLAYISGGRAEDVVRDLPGVVRSTIEVHEDAAKIALIVAIILGVSSIAAWRTEPILKLQGIAHALTFTFALITLGTMGYAASLGGAIHHPEVAPSFQAPAPIDNRNAD